MPADRDDGWGGKVAKIKGVQYVALAMDYWSYPSDCVAAGIHNNPFHGQFHSCFTRYWHYLAHYLAGDANKI